MGRILALPINLPTPSCTFVGGNLNGWKGGGGGGGGGRRRENWWWVSLVPISDNCCPKIRIF
jgi:hypothetical protein